MKLAVIFPSRGLAFSQTCEELLENLEGFDYDIFFSHGLPIPDCFNRPLDRALRGLYTHFWFIEEDMIIPKDTLKRLLEADVPAICCDYPVTKEGKPSAFRDPDDNLISGGTGCLLVTREFIEQYDKPIFRTDVAWDIKIGDRFEATAREVKGNVYGLHDVNFALEAYEHGSPIKISNIRCGQRKLIALGKPGTNNGEHIIETWTHLKPEILKVKKLTHQNVMIDGKPVFMSIKRAKELKLNVPNSYVELIR